MSNATLLYLYGVVSAEAPAPTAEVQGLEGASVRLVRVDDLAAVVSELPLEGYDERTLDTRMSDVQWVGERGLAHERVLTWFVDRGPVVPFTPFSLHHGEEAVTERIRERVALLRDALGRVQGRREWGIKLWRDEERFAERLDAESPVLRELGAELEGASAGRRFLLVKKRDALRTDEARRISHETARAVFRALTDCAVGSRALELPPPIARGPRALVLHAAFLVSDEEYGAFEELVQQLATTYTRKGFDWEFTGPWPPYHFTSI